MYPLELYPSCLYLVAKTHTCIHTLTDDSDVDMLTVTGGSDPQASSLNRAVSSRQPIVHFEGSVREPIGPRDIEYSPQVNEKK